MLERKARKKAQEVGVLPAPVDSWDDLGVADQTNPCASGVIR